MRFAVRTPCICPRFDPAAEHQLSIPNIVEQPRKPSPARRREISCQSSKLWNTATRPLTTQPSITKALTADLGDGRPLNAVDVNRACKLDDAVLVARTRSCAEMAEQFHPIGANDLADTQRRSFGNISFQGADSARYTELPGTTAMGGGVPSDRHGPQARWESSISRMGTASRARAGY